METAAQTTELRKRHLHIYSGRVIAKCVYETFLEAGQRPYSGRIEPIFTPREECRWHKKLNAPTKPQPTRTSTVSLTINGIEWTASATTQAEALAAIAGAAEQERAGK